MEERQGGFLMSRIKQVGDRSFNRILAERGVEEFNGAQGRILYVLWHADGVPIRELSRYTGLATATLTSMLDRMEASGLVRREHDEADRRCVLVHLTDKSEALREVYEGVTAEISAIYYAGFSEDEIDKFEGYLLRILANLEGE